MIVKNTNPQITQMNADWFLTWLLEMASRIGTARGGWAEQPDLHRSEWADRKRPEPRTRHERGAMEAEGRPNERGAAEDQNTPHPPQPDRGNCCKGTSLKTFLTWLLQGKNLQEKKLDLTWYLQERTLQERIWLLICGFDLDLLHQFLVGDGVVAMTVGPGGHHAKLYEIGSSLLRDAVLDLRGS